MHSIDARHSVAALLAGTVLLAGCGRSDHSAAMADTAMGQPSAAGSSAGVAMTTPAGSTATAGADTARPTDANIVAEMEGGDSSEVAVASYMESHASSAGVKSYAKMLVDDHGKALRETRALASKLAITPQTPPGDTTAQKTAHTLEHLKSLSGTNADTAFVNGEVIDHQHDIPAHREMASQARSAELKSALEKSIPVLQKHLDRARQLQQQEK